MTKLKGIIAPFTTPFTEDGDINLNLIKPQVDWLIENGVHGLAAGGSTGEGLPWPNQILISPLNLFPYFT